MIAPEELEQLHRQIQEKKIRGCPEFEKYCKGWKFESSSRRVGQIQYSVAEIAMFVARRIPAGREVAHCCQVLRNTSAESNPSRYMRRQLKHR